MPTLRALIIDDSADDADLLCRELTRNGYDVESTRVDTSDDLDLALRARSWDIIFSDWHMPRFSGPEALEVVKAHGLDLPFIIVRMTSSERRGSRSWSRRSTASCEKRLFVATASRWRSNS